MYIMDHFNDWDSGSPLFACSCDETFRRKRRRRKSRRNSERRTGETVTRLKAKRHTSNDILSNRYQGNMSRQQIRSRLNVAH
jgi:hypothetical protein